MKISGTLMWMSKPFSKTFNSPRWTLGKPYRNLSKDKDENFSVFIFIFQNQIHIKLNSYFDISNENFFSQYAILFSWQCDLELKFEVNNKERRQEQFHQFSTLKSVIKVK
ncbi:CLUMA_CG016982, isoform A [Clunio marinus]|uniref:CLUMA_CG016982, isoform A n=1 Tax=Clunio marinus TaxID=568069 RepID=A0A1J1IWA1_9DIPT|nr:CLUMA_CG016982, isoform A [Clunio marinus]